MQAKTKLQAIARVYLDSEKPAPFPVGAKITESFTVTAPAKVSSFDPVNFHPTEKVIVDTLVKGGILEDDNGSVIPEVKFYSGGKKGKSYKFRLVMEEARSAPMESPPLGVGTKNASLFN